MQHHKEFCRFADEYGRYSLIQDRVAKALVKRIDRGYSRIVDLGSGSGAFFKAYERPFISYLAVDISKQMLALHPSGEGVEKILGDFDDPSLFKRLEGMEFDLLVSSSALQWSRDLNLAIERIASLKRKTALSIFTSGTFASLHKVAGTKSPIRSTEETIEAIKRHLDAKIDILKYRLYFKDTLSMLRYIKRSGVSGGERRLSYHETKRVLRDYRLSYLEFEIVVSIGK
ncbi:MAG: methyltransferase domain-containing protein [Hydrogenimonas sp.]|nr:methyltransferase domain-containing protein [Hydrogenimonas sp.]